MFFLNKLIVLIVDDDMDIREIIKFYFINENIECIMVMNGNEVLERI